MNRNDEVEDSRAGSGYAVVSGDSFNHQENDDEMETILIVDDERLIREVWRRFLSKQGYTVLLSETGEEALELVRRGNEDIDLVILDLNMPGMGGMKCLEELNKINSGAPILVSSGYFSESETDNAKKFGATEFIPKPMDLGRFKETIRSVLDKRIFGSMI